MIRLVSDTSIPPGVYDGLAGQPTAVALPVLLEGSGRVLRADRLLRRLPAITGDKGAAAGTIVLLTDRPLAAAGCDRVFGLADPRRQVAVVSLAGLADPCDRERAASRMRNVLLHELAHLRGCAHCDDAACLMFPAAEPRDIDARSAAPCLHCASRRSAAPIARRSILNLRPLAACLSLAAAVLACDAVLTHAVVPPRLPPFT